MLLALRYARHPRIEILNATTVRVFRMLRFGSVFRTCACMHTLPCVLISYSIVLLTMILRRDASGKEV